jgi:hypothetical protein
VTSHKEETSTGQPKEDDETCFQSLNGTASIQTFYTKKSMLSAEVSEGSEDPEEFYEITIRSDKPFMAAQIGKVPDQVKQLYIFMHGLEAEDKHSFTAGFSGSDDPASPSDVAFTMATTA